MNPMRPGRLLAAAAALLLGACAAYGPGPLAPGQTLAEVDRRMGPPTGRHLRPDGTTRLEYARGPYGKHTWMIDVDGSGRVLAIEQVLDEEHFSRITAGMPREAVLALIGRPSSRRPGGWQGGEIWAWRYDAVFCQWFQATVTDQGTVRDTGYGADPLCEDLYTDH